MILSKKGTAKFLLATIVGASTLTGLGGTASASEINKPTLNTEYKTSIQPLSFNSTVKAYANLTPVKIIYLADDHGLVAGWDDASRRVFIAVKGDESTKKYFTDTELIRAGAKKVNDHWEMTDDQFVLMVKEKGFLK
ncbi:hypothetical protein [Clostridium sp. Marseille-QA1073]